MGASTDLFPARGMGVLIDEPTYPVQHRAPNAAQVVSGFDGYDYGRMLGWTGLAIPFGLAVGGPIKRPSAVCAAMIGGLGAFLYSYQQSSGRLMGFTKRNF